MQIETVFHSLVSNAIEAISAEDPRVRRICVTAHNAQDGWMQCSVADTGAGVDPAIVDRLFDPFVTTKPAGIGMALAMSRSIIESHGGRLWVESSGEGGTEFRFLLPTVSAKGAAHDGQ